MVDFVNKIKLSYQKYQNNGTVTDKNYKGKLLFAMNDFMSLGTYFQSTYFMSTIFLKDNIYGFRVQQFHLCYICKYNIFFT